MTCSAFLDACGGMLWERVSDVLTALRKEVQLDGIALKPVFGEQEIFIVGLRFSVGKHFLCLVYVGLRPGKPVSPTLAIQQPCFCETLG